MFDYLRIFRSKSIFPVIILTIAIFLIFSFFSFLLLQNYKSALYREYRNEIAFVSKIKAFQISSWYKGRLSDGETVTNNPYIYREMLKFTSGAATREDTLKRIQWLGIFNIASHYKNILLTDEKGRFIIRQKNDLDSLSLDTRSFLDRSKLQKQLLFTDFYWCDYCKEYHLDMVCPIKDFSSGGKVHGFVIFRIDPNNIIFPFINYIDYKHETMESFIIEGKNGYVMVPDRPRLYKGSDSNFRISSSDTLSVEIQASALDSGFVTGKDYRGKRVLGYVSNINLPSWKMITKVDISEVEHLYYLTSVYVYLFIIFSTIVLGFVLTIIWKNQRLKEEKVEAYLEMEKQMLLKKYDVLSKYANDIILILDVQFNIVDCNDKAEEFYGYGREKLLSMNINDLRYTYNVADLRLDEEDLSAGKIYETTHRKANGEIVSVEASTRRIEVGGKPFLHSIIRDITDRKRSEAALKRSNEELALRNMEIEASRERLSKAEEELKEQIGELLSNREQMSSMLQKLKMLENIIGKSQTVAFRWKASDGWPVIYASENVSVWGYRAAEMMEKEFNYASIMNREDIERVSKKLDSDILEGKTESYYEYRIYTAAGEERIVSERTIYEKSREGGPSFYDGIVTDITESKAVEKQIAVQAEAMNAAMDAIAITDSEGRIIYINNSFARMFDYSSSRDAISLHWSTHYPDALSKNIIASGIEEALSSGEWKGDAVASSFSGKTVRQDITITSIDTGGFIFIARDTTRRMLMEEELLQRRKMDAIGRLAGGVAHDFNNMLAGIMGNAEMLDSKLDKKSPFKKYVKSIIDASENSADLIEKLLTFARKEKSRMAEESITSLITDVAEILKKTFDKKIRIDKDIRVTQDKIFLNKQEVESALFNLAFNAKDAMEDGGILKFEAASEHLDGKSGISKEMHAEKGDYLRITVSDTGKGMDKATLLHVFEPFFSTKPTGQGTGLGLASVFGTVKSHGGYIDIDSSVGGGTRVNILIPYRENTPGTKNADCACIKKAIIIDDDEVSSKAAEEMLSSANSEISSFRSAKSAIEYIERNGSSIDAVISEMMLNDMSCREFLLKAAKLAPNAKFIIVSENNPVDAADDIFKSGSVVFLKKPFNRAELISALKQFPA